jgi:hypothetical protein
MSRRRRESTRSPGAFSHRGLRRQVRTPTLLRMVILDWKEELTICLTKSQSSSCSQVQHVIPHQSDVIAIVTSKWPPSRFFQSKMASVYRSCAMVFIATSYYNAITTTCAGFTPNGGAATRSRACSQPR